MNPAILKALVEALKKGGKILGSGTGVSGLAGRGGLAGRVKRTFDPRKSPLKEGPRPQGSQTWRGKTKSETPYRGPGQGVPKDPTHGARYRGKIPNWLSGDTLGADLTKLGLTTTGAGTGLGLLFGGEEDEVAADDAKAYRPQYGASTPEWNAGSEVQSRVKFQQSQDAKFNRQMKKLLLNYGIVNLVNPDSGEEMLKIGMAILKQDLEASGDARKAEIFDSVFTPGNMPKTAKTAYERVLKAGGTPADAAEISGAYVDMRPPASKAQKKEDVAAQVVASVQQLLAAGQDSQARSLLRQYIMSDHIGRTEDSAGIKQPIDVQVDEWIKMLGGGGAKPLNPGGVTIDG